MEHIRRAVERAKNGELPNSQFQLHQTSKGGPPGGPPNEVILNGAYLESKRVIGHEIADPRSKSFDMLRTQMLQSMDANSWQFVGVTSPTEGCGKSVIATNLALSIARQPERSVLLIDMDLQNRQVANQLGLRCSQGLVSTLEGRTTLAQAIIPARIKNSKFLVLPCERSVPNSSEWIASRAMAGFLEDIRRSFRNWTVIFDLPPILVSDDVISILPHIDCVLFVAAAGFTTAPQIKDCNKHLEATPVVRIVLNKATDAAATSYYPYSKYGGGYARAKNGRARSSDLGRPGQSSVKNFFDRLTRF